MRESANELADSGGRILVIEDDAAVRAAFALALESAGHELEFRDDAAAGIEAVESARPDLVIVDHLLPGDMLGDEACARIRAAHPDLPILYVSGVLDLARLWSNGNRVRANACMRKPFAVEELRARIRELLAAGEGVRRLAKNCELVGDDPAFRDAVRAAREAAPHDVTVFLVGETGTGKGALASEIHRWSGRRRGPFVHLACPDISPSLAESSLFGHSRGAFTGAIESRAGCFEAAHGGTLFLDELDSLAPDLQAKLLRVLDDGTVQRLGEASSKPVSFRVVAATKSNPRELVRRGILRDDLLHRLWMLPIFLPPLRLRRGDVPRLARHFLSVASRRHGMSPPRLDPALLAQLGLYTWPGNVRELANVVERLVLLGLPLVTLNTVPPDLAEVLAAGESAHRSVLVRGAAAGGDDWIEVLRECDGNVTAAARALGITRYGLYKRLRRSGRPPGDFRRRRDSSREGPGAG